MNFQDLLSQLSTQIQDDPNLNDEVRDSAMELISLVASDPTPDNLRALAVVLETLGDTTRYLSALETIKNFEATEAAAKSASPAAGTPPASPSTPPTTP